MTYSLTATVWGIIGDATAGGWGAQTNMNYNATTMEFWLGAHLTAETTSLNSGGHQTGSKLWRQFRKRYTDCRRIQIYLWHLKVIMQLQ